MFDSIKITGKEKCFAISINNNKEIVLPSTFISYSDGEEVVLESLCPKMTFSCHYSGITLDDRTFVSAGDAVSSLASVIGNFKPGGGPPSTTPEYVNEAIEAHNVGSESHDDIRSLIAQEQQAVSDLSGFVQSLNGAFVPRGKIAIETGSITPQLLTDRIVELLERSPQMGDVLVDADNVEWYSNGEQDAQGGYVWINYGQSVIINASNDIYGIVKGGGDMDISGGIMSVKDSVKSLFEKANGMPDVKMIAYDKDTYNAPIDLSDNYNTYILQMPPGGYTAAFLVFNNVPIEYKKFEIIVIPSGSINLSSQYEYLYWETGHSPVSSEIKSFGVMEFVAYNQVLYGRLKSGFGY